jgi:hypothetical protein
MSVTCDDAHAALPAAKPSSNGDRRDAAGALGKSETVLLSTVALTGTTFGWASRLSRRTPSGTRTTVRVPLNFTV